MSTKKIIKTFSLFLTLYGIYLIITGNLTDGLLALILGELVDMPKADLI